MDNSIGGEEKDDIVESEMDGEVQEGIHGRHYESLNVKGVLSEKPPS